MDRDQQEFALKLIDALLTQRDVQRIAGQNACLLTIAPKNETEGAALRFPESR
jgi:hypothetical protein